MSVPRVEIGSVTFGRITDASKLSYVSITSHDGFKGDSPVDLGIFDGRMGSTDDSRRCKTCDQRPGRGCMGHCGHISLKLPIVDPLMYVSVRKWLKVICFVCGSPIATDTRINAIKGVNRLEALSKIATKNVHCAACGAEHPTILKSSDPYQIVYRERDADSGDLRSRILVPQEIRKILSRVTDETVARIAPPRSGHPASYIISDIIVAPAPCRPRASKNFDDQVDTKNQNSILQQIIKRNNAISATGTITADETRAQYEIAELYDELVKRSTGDNGAIKSIAAGLKGKEGLIRSNLLGKRCRYMCRSTICGDPAIKPNEIGIPIYFARTMKVREVVQDHNIEILSQMVRNGPRVYPGASMIEVDGAKLSTAVRTDIVLENGNVVYRNLMDGDVVYFNRQPSLKFSNMTAHTVRVIRDDRIRAVRMNVMVCPLYGADFDGDQMNVIPGTCTASRNEMRSIGNFTSMFISQITGAPSIGQVDDSIVGSALLTREVTVMNRYHTMLLFSAVKSTHFKFARYLPDFAQESYTGREAFSLVLQNTPINFRRGTEWYKPNLTPFITDYVESERETVIVNGKMISGLLDKKSICKESSGNICHLVALDYGVPAALDVAYNIQQLALAYTMQRGFTIGIMDIIIKPEVKTKIDEIASGIMEKSQRITDELINGILVPPIGHTVAEYYEMRQMSELRIMDDFAGEILRNTDHYHNNLFTMIMVGSKGSLENFYNIVSAIGQKQINGERLRDLYDPGRTMPYFPRFCTRPESRGYIRNSYLSGMDVAEYISDSEAARFDFITKALGTSITGDQNRKSNKNMESAVCTNARMTAKGRNIIQLFYGEDGMVAHRTEIVEFPTVRMGDAELKDKYLHPEFQEEFELVRRDRDKYRDIFMRPELLSIKEQMQLTRSLPAHPRRILETAVARFADCKASDSLEAMVAEVRKFCDDAPYMLLNEELKNSGMEVPPQISAVMWLLCMSVRSFLHPNALEATGIKSVEFVKFILDIIRVRVLIALCDPGTAVGTLAAQAVSEPTVQYMLDAHRRSAIGGTTKTGIAHFNAVVGAKPVDKLPSSSMLIALKMQTDALVAQRVVDSIVMMKFGQFTSSWQLFFETFGQPEHPDYVDEKGFIDKFVKIHGFVPGDLTKWCLRYEMDRTNLIAKRISLEQIIVTMRDNFAQQVFLVYTPENANRIVVRAYLRQPAFTASKKVDDVVKVLKFNDVLLAFPVNGIAGVYGAEVVNPLRTVITPDGTAQSRDVDFMVQTNGTNLARVMAHPEVDPSRTTSDAVLEVFDVLGIEAARLKIISGIRENINSTNCRHFMMYADEMTYTGNVTSMDASGLAKREPGNVLLRAGMSDPLRALSNAARNGARVPVEGVTGPLMIGSMPKHGTAWQTYTVNKEFVRANMARADTALDALH